MTDPSVHPCGKPAKRARWTRYVEPVAWILAALVTFGLGWALGYWPLAWVILN